MAGIYECDVFWSNGARTVGVGATESEARAELGIRIANEPFNNGITTIIQTATCRYIADRGQEDVFKAVQLGETGFRILRNSGYLQYNNGFGWRDVIWNEQEAPPQMRVKDIAGAVTQFNTPVLVMIGFDNTLLYWFGKGEDKWRESYEDQPYRGWFPWGEGVRPRPHRRSAPRMEVQRIVRFTNEGRDHMGEEQFRLHVIGGDGSQCQTNWGSVHFWWDDRDYDNQPWTCIGPPVA